MDIPQNLIELAEKNNNLLENIGFTPDDDNPLDLCTEQAYLATGLFTEQQVKKLFCFEKDASPREARAPICPQIGMLLVRPDMYHLHSCFEDFIARRFSLIESQDVVMSQNAYWEIYSHDLYRPETMHSRLTRAVMYMGSICRLIVFTESDISNGSLSDKVVHQLKGTQGTFCPDTLRGDLVLHEALRLGLHEVASRDQTQQATDPFLAYRRFLTSPGPHESADWPLLFYTGVGVHVPDSSEISGDLHALNPNLADELTAD